MPSLIQKNGIRQALTLVMVVGGLFGLRPARAQSVEIDRTAVRFIAPETGGARNPRFLSARLVSFEARLRQLESEPGRIDAPVDERYVREAIEHHIAEEILVRLPIDDPPSPKEVARLAESMRKALEVHVGGAAVLKEVAARDGIASTEVEEFVYRIALSALCIDRKFAPILRFTEEQLRDAFRTANHPFREESFEQAKDAFSSYLALDKLRAAEGAFLQGDRGRIVITTVTR